jgi:hypothetical protein
MDKFRLYHAPWTKSFKTFVLKGAFAYELQLGPVVLQWFYEPWPDARWLNHRLHIWKDRFWRS